MSQLVASISGVVLGGVVEVVSWNLARGKIFTVSIGSVDLLYPSVFIYCVNLHQFLILCSSKAMTFVKLYFCLGGHFGLSCSPRLGLKKRVTTHYIHILLYNMILFFLCRPLSCQVEVLSMTLDMQRCNDLYRLNKFPYIRRPNTAKTDSLANAYS